MVFLFGTVLLVGLILLSWIDLKTYRLPDILTLPLIAIGIIHAWYLPPGLHASLIGAFAGYLFFVAIELGFRHIRKKDGLGRGDAKLLAVGGAWCGWAGLPFIVLIASGSGLIAALFPSFRRRAENGRLPFGPFLAFGIGLVWLSLTYVG